MLGIDRQEAPGRGQSALPFRALGEAGIGSRLFLLDFCGRMRAVWDEKCQMGQGSTVIEKFLSFVLLIPERKKRKEKKKESKGAFTMRAEDEKWPLMPRDVDRTMPSVRSIERAKEEMCAQSSLQAATAWWRAAFAAA